MAKVHDPNFVALVEQARNKILECSAEDLISMLADDEDIFIIDVREADEFVRGYLQGAVNLSKGIIERDIAKQGLDQEHRIVLYCGGGYRSALAADNLRMMGWSNVYSLWGGWRAILASDLVTSIPE